MILKNWYIQYIPAERYLAPELTEQCLGGDVYGHPRIKEGQHVVTSAIVRKTENNEVETKSGSIYVLDTVAPFYEEQYPDAFNRLISSL